MPAKCYIFLSPTKNKSIIELNVSLMYFDIINVIIQIFIMVPCNGSDPQSLPHMNDANDTYFSYAMSNI